VTRVAELREEAERLRSQLADIATPGVRRRVQALIEELEAEARSLDNGDAELSPGHRERH
jgi:hypothetical protein